MAKDGIDVIFGPGGVDHEERGSTKREGVVVVHEQSVIHEYCSAEDR